MQETANAYTQSSPKNIEDLLNLMKSQISRMSSLSLGRFLSSWMDYYHEPALLAVDTIEYLVFMIICLLSGNNIINVAASDIVKNMKGINQLRGELLKLVPNT